MQKQWSSYSYACIPNRSTKFCHNIYGCGIEISQLPVTSYLAISSAPCITVTLINTCNQHLQPTLAQPDHTLVQGIIVISACAVFPCLFLQR